jgi:hypothetical protein
VEIAGVDATGLVRYQLHDLLADFARERLAQSESESEAKDAFSRLAEMYIASAHRACESMGRKAEPYDARTSNVNEPMVVPVDEDPQAWFSSERSRLVAVVEQAHALEFWDQAWRLTEILPVLFDWRADWRSWEHTHRLALDATSRLGDERAEAMIRTTLGMLYRELGKYDLALASLRRAIFDRAWASTTICVNRWRERESKSGTRWSSVIAIGLSKQRCF